MVIGCSPSSKASVNAASTRDMVGLKVTVARGGELICGEVIRALQGHASLGSRCLCLVGRGRRRSRVEATSSLAGLRSLAIDR